MLVRRYESDVTTFSEAVATHSDEYAVSMMESKRATPAVPADETEGAEDSAEEVPSTVTLIGNPLFYQRTLRGKPFIPLAEYWKSLQDDLIIAAATFHGMFNALDRAQDTAITVDRSITWRTTGGVESENLISAARNLGHTGRPKSFLAVVLTYAVLDHQRGLEVILDLKRKDDLTAAIRLDVWLATVLYEFPEIAAVIGGGSGLALLGVGPGGGSGQYAPLLQQHTGSWVAGGGGGPTLPGVGAGGGSDLALLGVGLGGGSEQYAPLLQQQTGSWVAGGGGGPTLPGVGAGGGSGLALRGVGPGGGSGQYAPLLQQQTGS
ncbi:hypothetical protein PLESTB_001484400 [Pleodorina starrii]|uniref:Uncharacterized protein n=1 Tax=Pleodorina starrii TaxID=330485 RepID=A0A9W6BX14_9CHLO|nr:hypothetical protein PLESTB_001484400 [Pleodorina starrii]